MAKPASISIPTEPIGSIPRPADLIERVAKGDSEDPSLAPFFEDAVRDTIERFEAAGSPVVTDGEQRKYFNFASYCVHGIVKPSGAVFASPCTQYVIRGNCRALHAARSGTGGTQTVTWMSPCAMRMFR